MCDDGNPIPLVYTRNRMQSTKIKFKHWIQQNNFTLVLELHAEVEYHFDMHLMRRASRRGIESLVK
jgi:hypothetical protein